MCQCYIQCILLLNCYRINNNYYYLIIIFFPHERMGLHDPIGVLNKPNIIIIIYTFIHVYMYAIIHNILLCNCNCQHLKSIPMIYKWECTIYSLHLMEAALFVYSLSLDKKCILKSHSVIVVYMDYRLYGT